MKPTILMLPSWYPTSENPFVGSFFREQALVMQENFNFVVLTVRYKGELACVRAVKNLFHIPVKPNLKFVQDDNGLQEYCLTIRTPRFIIWDLLVQKFNSYVKKQRLPMGIGRIENHAIKNARISAILYLKKNNLLPTFDCIYSLTSQDIANLGNDFARMYKVPHVTAEHAPFPNPGQVLSDSIAEAIEKADAFLAISNDKIRQVLLQNIKINPVWVGNYCDESRFRPSVENHTTPTILIVGASSYIKNFPLFIRAMEELKQIATKDFKIMIAGYNANKEYSQSPKDLEELVRCSSVRDNITMIESVSREDMPALYNACDIFVMTSIQEGMPVSALEACMSGLPVITTRCGGVEDYIDDSMGRIVSITDYRGIAEACNQILNGEIEFDRKHIREKTINIFGKEAFVSRISNVFFSVIEKNKRKLD